MTDQPRKLSMIQLINEEARKRAMIKWLNEQIVLDEASPDCDGSGEYATCDQRSTERPGMLAALRVIVAAHAPSPDCWMYCRTCGCGDCWPERSPCTTLRAVLRAYSGRRGFDSAWLA